VKQGWEIEEKHTLSRDEKARESEGDKDKQQSKSTHQLGARRRGKVSETGMGNRRKAHTN
jgi:hypothetical protein